MDNMGKYKVLLDRTKYSDLLEYPYIDNIEYLYPMLKRITELSGGDSEEDEIPSTLKLNTKKLNPISVDGRYDLNRFYGIYNDYSEQSYNKSDYFTGMCNLITKFSNNKLDDLMKLDSIDNMKYTTQVQISMKDAAIVIVNAHVLFDFFRFAGRYIDFSFVIICIKDKVVYGTIFDDKYCYLEGFTGFLHFQLATYRNGFCLGKEFMPGDRINPANEDRLSCLIHNIATPPRYTKILLNYIKSYMIFIGNCEPSFDGLINHEVNLKVERKTEYPAVKLDGSVYSVSYESGIILYDPRCEIVIICDLWNFDKANGGIQRLEIKKVLTLDEYYNLSDHYHKSIYCSFGGNNYKLYKQLILCDYICKNTFNKDDLLRQHRMLNPCLLGIADYLYRFNISSKDGIDAYVMGEIFSDFYSSESKPSKSISRKARKVNLVNESGYLDEYITKDEKSIVMYDNNVRTFRIPLDNLIATLYNIGRRIGGASRRQCIVQGVNAMIDLEDIEEVDNKYYNMQLRLCIDSQIGGVYLAKVSASNRKIEEIICEFDSLEKGLEFIDKAREAI